MNKFEVRALIRETIFELLEESETFSFGDRVVTYDGEEGNISLVKHPFYAVTLDDTGVTKSYHYNKLNGIDDKSDNKFYGKYDVDPQGEEE